MVHSASQLQPKHKHKFLKNFKSSSVSVSSQYETQQKNYKLRVHILEVGILDKGPTATEWLGVKVWCLHHHWNVLVDSSFSWTEAVGPQSHPSVPDHPLGSDERHTFQ